MAAKKKMKAMFFMMAETKEVVAEEQTESC